MEVRGRLPLGARKLGLTDGEKLRELDRLVAMAKTLGEMASRHTEDEGLQLKEASLARGPKEYYTAIRGGRRRQRLGVDEQNRCHRQAYCANQKTIRFMVTPCRQGRPCSSCLAQCPWSAD
ncbi:unnamed protein product [Ectocarpus fasciculatus]